MATQKISIQQQNKEIKIVCYSQKSKIIITTPLPKEYVLSGLTTFQEIFKFIHLWKKKRSVYVDELFSENNMY